jgi:hypothetical protein
MLSGRQPQNIVNPSGYQFTTQHGSHKMPLTDCVGRVTHGNTYVHVFASSLARSEPNISLTLNQQPHFPEPRHFIPKVRAPTSDVTNAHRLNLAGILCFWALVAMSSSARIALSRHVGLGAARTLRREVGTTCIKRGIAPGATWRAIEKQTRLQSSIGEYLFARD